MTRLTLIACVLLVLSGIMQAQTTTLSLTVADEGALVIPATTNLTNTGSFSPFTGVTNYTYLIRTGASGTGTLTLKVTTDFGTGGPSVANSGTTGDTLTYTNTMTGPGTAATGTQTASTASGTSVGGVGNNAHTPKAGSSGTVSWTLVDDPVYTPGPYSAVVTFTLVTT